MAHLDMVDGNSGMVLPVVEGPDDDAAADSRTENPPVALGSTLAAVLHQDTVVHSGDDNVANHAVVHLEDRVVVKYGRDTVVLDARRNVAIPWENFDDHDDEVVTLPQKIPS